MARKFSVIVGAALVLFATAIGCGGSGSSTSGGSPSGATSGGSTSGGQNCSHAFSCINGACSCDDGPKKGSSCCDPMDMNCPDNKCDTFCQHCM